MEHYQSCEARASGDLKDCHCEGPLYTKAAIAALIAATIAVITSYYSGSSALIADGAHSLADSADTFVSLAVLYLVRRYPGEESYLRMHGGWVAFALLYLTTAVVFLCALDRLIRPVEVGGVVMMIGAAAGIILNGYIIFISHHTHEEERTVTHAQLHIHVLSDLLVSVGVLAGGIFIWITGYDRIDGIIAMAIALYLALIMLPKAYRRAVKM